MTDVTGSIPIRREDSGGYLTRSAILTVDDSKFEDVPVPEWGGTVRVKAISGTDRDAFEAAMVEMKGSDITLKQENTRARFVSMTIVDCEGNLIMTPADVVALGKKSAAALSRVYDVGQKLSRISDKDIKELVKNSDGVRTDASSSS
jgi:hypothetical protein